MAYGFLDIAMPPSVRAAQAANGSAKVYADFRGRRAFHEFTDAEAEFIAARESFYMATVSETGWPYVQHRGGPAGFLRMLDKKTLACADFRGNRQYISVGNLATNDRACLFLMDYPRRQRLKIYVRVELVALSERPELFEKLVTPGYAAKVERALVFHLQAFDWNCSQHITPRFSQKELEPVLSSARARIDTLEAENRQLAERLQRAEAKAC